MASDIDQNDSGVLQSFPDPAIDKAGIPAAGERESDGGSTVRRVVLYDFEMAIDAVIIAGQGRDCLHDRGVKALPSCDMSKCSSAVIRLRRIDRCREVPRPRSRVLFMFTRRCRLVLGSNLT